MVVVCLFIIYMITVYLFPLKCVYNYDIFPQSAFIIMIKDQNREAITQRDELVQQMVAKTYKQMRELGQFETIYEIFSKLPISRIQKEQYQFLFDSVKQNIQQLITRQDQLHKIIEKEDDFVRKIEVKTYKDKISHLAKNKNIDHNPSTVNLGNHDFSHVVQGCFGQKLGSAKPIFKSIGYLRKQARPGIEYFGENAPFQPDQQYLNLKQIKYEIGDIRMFYNNQDQLKKFEFEFADQNRVQFRTRSFPSNAEMQHRAEILAKIYLLHIYRQQGRKAKQIYKNNEIQMNKQRQIRKIKQQLDVQKIKQGQMIQQMDLIKQVYKILMLIEKKMNQLAFSQFQQKNGQKATQIKRSLQKLKSRVNEQGSARNKLKLLITYKHNKGW